MNKRGKSPERQLKTWHPRKRSMMAKMIVVAFKLISFVVNTTLTGIEHGIEGILNKLRFSISFKLTLTFIMIYLLFFGLFSAGIAASYNSFYQSGSEGNFANKLNGVLGFFNLVGVVLIGVVGSRVSKKLLSPIDKMTSLAKEISIDDLSNRLDVSGTKDELKDLSKTINDMLDRLQTSVDLQNQFVSDASHELRTPIAVIQGYANLIDRWGKDDPKILDESISSIKSESEWMKNLVEKLLFLARSDKNTQKLDKTKFMLNEIIDEVYKETMMIDDQHRIVNNRSEEIELYADKSLLKEAFRIFVDNSIKYTPAGGFISIDAFKERNSAVIVVRDTGVGISREDLPNIFNRFYRVDKSRTKASGGTGLGLGIAKWIIEHHNGKINVISQLDQGTEITIRIPLNNY